MVKVDEWSSINWSSKNGTNMTIHTCEQDSEFVLRFVCTVSKTAWARARCTALRGMGFPPSAPTHILVRHEFIFRYHLCEMSLIPFLLNTYSYVTPKPREDAGLNQTVRPLVCPSPMLPICCLVVVAALRHPCCIIVASLLLIPTSFLIGA